MATHRTRSIRTVLVPISVAVAAVLTVGLLPATGEAQPKPSLTQVEGQISVLNDQAETAGEAYNNAQVAMNAGQKVLNQTNARVARSQAAVTAAQVSVGRIASAAYRSGGVDQTLQLLLADNPSQFLDQASALDGVSRRQSDVLRVVDAARQRLAQDKLAAAQQLGQLQALRDSAAKYLRAVKAKQAAAYQLFRTLTAAQQAQILAQQRAAAAARRAAAQRAASSQRGSRHGGHAPYVGGSGIGARVVAYAMNQVGDNYVFGATGMSSWDCSGLTMRAYQSVGIYLPHSSRAQFSDGRHIPRSQLQPGDLVFFYSPIHHVGIYIGGGMIVHAANPSEGVLTAPLSSMPFSGAVRPY